MDDSISRQAAIDWLKNEWDGMVTSVFRGIESLPSAQTEWKWIPCSEQLPEYEKDVLCVTKLGVMYVASYEERIAPCSNEKGWITSDFVRYRPNYIVAWMPLPEPYKGGNK